MNIEALIQLAQDNPVEYVRQAFEDEGEWHHGVFLTSGHIRSALHDYLSTFPVRKIPFRLIMHAIGEERPPDTPVKEWIQKMADNFEGTLLCKLFFDAFDGWARGEENSGSTTWLAACIENYFDYLGNCIYKQHRFPISTVSDSSDFQWRKSIDAKAHVELLIRYFNDRLSDEDDFKRWNSCLPRLFRPENKSYARTDNTGIYYLFLYELLSTDKSHFIFTPLSKKTKCLITLCFYERRWSHRAARYFESEHFYEHNMFILATDMILRERLCLPEELDPDLLSTNTKLKGASLFERMIYSSNNQSLVKGMNENRRNNEEKLERMIVDYLHLRRPLGLLNYIDNEPSLFNKSLLNALRISLSGRCENEFTQRTAAKMVLNQSARIKLLEQTNPDQWKIVYELAKKAANKIEK